MAVPKFLLVLAAVAVSTGSAAAAECPRNDALGTSRTLEVDAAASPRLGRKSFPQTLPLADKEVVLTFDDGPFPPTTRRILSALAHECVLATFFLIGQSAEAVPDLVRAMAAAGHTIGYHSWSHPNLARTAPANARDNIERGISAVETALHGAPNTVPATAFFRFPYFASTPALLDELQSRHIVVFGADLWASDWDTMTPRQELGLIINRLQRARKGIVLFHDTKERTAAMLPEFLRFLHEHGYRIVHIAPKATVPEQREPR